MLKIIAWYDGTKIRCLSMIGNTIAKYEEENA
jgi:hypothetical protein